jgi:hypothetical protein
MTPENKQKWQRRSALKLALIHEGNHNPSGMELNLAAALPRTAIWRESNFTEAV